MSDWRRLADEDRWNEIQWLFLAPDDLTDLLARLRERVPIINVQNGTEIILRRLLPSEADSPGLKSAALLLQLGEIEAAVTDDDPPSASEEWRQVREAVKPELKRRQEMDEVTEGDPDLSRKAHANKALDLLARGDGIAALMKSTFDDPEVRRWFQEGVAEIAQCAFSAGSHAQLAGGKEMEALAIKSLERKQYGSTGGKAGAAIRQEELKTRERVEFMLGYLNRHPNASEAEAARAAEAKKLGKHEANRKLLREHRKKPGK